MTCDSGVPVFCTLSLVLAGALGIVPLMPLHSRGRVVGGSRCGRRRHADRCAQARAYQQETVKFQIGPGQFIEYKYRLAKSEALLSSWKSTGPVNVDLHAEPDGAPRGYAESHEKKDRITQGAGTLTAPFSGIHGSGRVSGLFSSRALSGIVQPVDCARARLTTPTMARKILERTGPDRRMNGIMSATLSA
jgi:hypothetical protein